MQIHELNNFTGTLGSGAYLAVDDGTDTGKLSTQQLLAATEARIDNIIAGPAPSAEEIVDARLGDDGVTYPSLGDAIRDQVGDLKSAINDIGDASFIDVGTMTAGKYIARLTGAEADDSGSKCSDYIAVEGGLTIRCSNVSSKGTRSSWCYGDDYTPINIISPIASEDTEFTATLPSNASYIRVSALSAQVPQILYTNKVSKTFESIENNVIELQDGLFGDDLVDCFELRSDGFAPQPVPCSVSYFNKVASTADAPFYPLPMGEWYPVSNLSGSFRYAELDFPSDLSNEAVTISFWVKYADISSSTAVKFALLDTSNNYVANFTRYVKSALYVGATQTVNGCTANVDKEINNWYHIKIAVPANKDLSLILFGSDYFNSSHRAYWSMPVIIKGNQYWFIKYKNKYYSGNSPFLADIIYGKKIGWFGDSIMLGRHTGEDYGWYNNLRSIGAVVTVKAINGAMVSVKGAGYHSIISETGASVFDSDTDYLIFDGGANDFFNRQPLGTMSESYSGSGLDTSTYIGALEQVCYNLLTNYPTAKIGYIIPYKMETYADIQAQKTYFDNAIEVCKKWGIPYLDMRYMCGLNYNISSLQQYFKDDVHINKNGYILTENIIAEWLRSI